MHAPPTSVRRDATATTASPHKLVALAVHDRDQLHAVPEQHILGMVRWASAASTAGDDLLPRGYEHIPCAHPHAPLLGTPSVAAADIWCAGPIVDSGKLGALHYRTSEHLAFVTVSLPCGNRPLQEVTRTIYGELFSVLDRIGYSQPLRLWNYVPDINADDDHAGPCGERYWEFNAGRQAAFRAHRRATTDEVPAASAVGVDSGAPLSLHCIAARQSGGLLENPRQCSAWNYPPQYGPQSPTFARACLASKPTDALFVSGTSSIVGHASCHAMDPGAQTDETLRNIRVLIDAANRRAGQQRFVAQDLHYTAYIRRQQDLPVISGRMRQQVGDHAAIRFLRADICRRDLLVEIEAVGV